MIPPASLTPGDSSPAARLPADVTACPGSPRSSRPVPLCPVAAGVGEVRPGRKNREGWVIRPGFTDDSPLFDADLLDG
jgi:hypothetical protein